MALNNHKLSFKINYSIFGSVKGNKQLPADQNYIEIFVSSCPESEPLKRIPIDKYLNFPLTVCRFSYGTSEMHYGSVDVLSLEDDCITVNICIDGQEPDSPYTIGTDEYLDICSDEGIFCTDEYALRYVISAIKESVNQSHNSGVLYVPFSSSVYEYEYKGLDDINEIVLAKGIKRIKYGAFYNCSNVDSIVFPDSLIEIQPSAFRGTSVTEIIIPPNVKTLSGFADCVHLTRVSLPKGLQCIDDSAFAGCTSLEYINIPESVKSIGFAAFRDCSSLKEITVPNEKCIISEYAFTGSGCVLKR